MKVKDNLKRLFVFSISIFLLPNSIACVKRIAISPDATEIKSFNNRIYVHLKPEKSYFDKSALLVTDPTVEGDYLIGSVQNKRIKILLNDIESIEIFRIDKKKTVRNILIGTAILTAITIYTLMTAIPPPD
jgi:hypothetical protein